MARRGGRGREGEGGEGEEEGEGREGDTIFMFCSRDTQCIFLKGPPTIPELNAAHQRNLSYLNRNMGGLKYYFNTTQKETDRNRAGPETAFLEKLDLEVLGAKIEIYEKNGGYSAKFHQKRT